jgi:hypothetical protein
MTYINVNDIEQMIETENISTIFLDVDGVVIDSVGAIVRILNGKYGTKCKSSDITSWNFNEIKSDLTSEEIEDIFNDEEFFNIVLFYDGVFNFIGKYRNKIIFLTKGNHENISHKNILFNSVGLSDVPLIGLPLSISKGWINMRRKGKSLFIDDCSQNLIDSNADIKIMMKEHENDAEWQIGWNGLKMKGWE